MTCRLRFLLAAVAAGLAPAGPAAMAEEAGPAAMAQDFEPLPDVAPAPQSSPRAPDTAATASPAAAMPAEELACRSRLRALGAVFEDAPPISEAEGCAAAHPLLLSELPDGVRLEPPALLTCAMAEATARFVEEVAAPAVEAEFGSDLAAVRQVSAYVCRPRNGSEKLSEHAFANALDWGGLELEDGQSITIRAHGHREPRRTRLIERLRQAACGPFRTVLGPGSDANHADHFHFDLAQRRNGGTFCQ